MLVSLFTRGTIRATQSKYGTGVITSILYNLFNSFSSFSLSRYDTGQSLKKQGWTVDSTFNQTWNPFSVPSWLWKNFWYSYNKLFKVDDIMTVWIKDQFSLIFSSQFRLNKHGFSQQITEGQGLVTPIQLGHLCILILQMFLLYKCKRKHLQVLTDQLDYK